MELKRMIGYEPRKNEKSVYTYKVKVTDDYGGYKFMVRHPKMIEFLNSRNTGDSLRTDPWLSVEFRNYVEKILKLHRQYHKNAFVYVLRYFKSKEMEEK